MQKLNKPKNLNKRTEIGNKCTLHKNKKTLKFYKFYLTPTWRRRHSTDPVRRLKIGIWRGEHHTTHPNMLCTTQPSTQSLGNRQDVAGRAPYYTPEYALHNTAIHSVAGESPRRGRASTILHTRICSTQHSHPLSRWGIA
ncbi:hypothetical protein RRG08_009358 [Elysia crispata]|uniref:Uncharacterized protein n=1 Tax=Elysia crispata TaxID=231223 RepID=A0AAE0Z2K4_9GAST|nr:hypothetical protein RRG08_009358 [Elysia crispata]